MCILNDWYKEKIHAKKKCIENLKYWNLHKNDRFDDINSYVVV